MNITWSVIALIVSPKEGEKINVVKEVDVGITVNDVSMYTHQVKLGPVSSTFIEYAALTEQVVLDWVFEVLSPYGIALHETLAINMVNEFLSPPLARKSVPWI